MFDPSPAQPDRPRRIDPPRAFAAVLIALGFSVLAGWWLGIEPLTRVLPGLISMKPNAALGFLLAGLALWPIREGRAVSRWAVGWSLAVVAIGALTLFEYAAGVDLGIDEFLSRVPGGGVDLASPGRMQPTTAFDFLILGIASALIAVDRVPRVAQALALIAALVGGSTLVAYLYGVRDFVGLAVFHQMALHTTLGMLAISAGLLMARPRRGLMASITDDGPSGVMARRLLPVAILTPIVVNGLEVLARDAGIFDERYGSAVQVTMLVAIFVGCIGRSSHALHRIDRERRRVEAERIEGERRYRFMAESMPHVVWLADPDGEVVYLNRRWFDYTGEDPALGPRWQHIFHPEELGPGLERWGRAIQVGETFQGEFRLLRRDGAYRWHLIQAEPMRDEAGRIVHWVGSTTDIHDQKHAGEQRYRSIVEATTAIVWNTPASGEFESDQPGWGNFTGQSFAQLAGWGWLEAIHPDDRRETARVWAAAVRDRAIYQVKHRLRRHDGEYRYMSVRAVPLLDDDGAIREWIGVHADVHDQEMAHEAMRLAKEAAEAATRAKGEFLANMSHEIRTPMNGVLGMTELALGTDLTPRQREYLSLVKSSADALLTVIDDILDFSKIEAGKLRLDPIPFSPRDVVTDALRSMALKAHGKGLELACRVAPEVPESVVGDPGRLRQVLMNLVGNAIKFTDRGEVVVTVEPGPDAANPGRLRFSVADTGIGIPPEKRDAIFAPFEQADGSTTRRFGGTGLGLSISSRLIAMMDGRIWVEENPGGGSIFRFDARLDGDPLAPVDRPSSYPVLLDGLRVLIVDDNRTNRMILEEILSQWGCRPLAVEGGAEALRVLDRSIGRGEPYPLILLDLMMPGMDGFELARRIKADPRQGSTRMLMLTSGVLEDSARARDLGIGGMLAKPIRQSELLNAILDLIGPDAALPPGPARPAGPSPRANGRSLRVLLAEDHPINQKVATRMLEDQGHRVTVAANGRLAVEALAASGPFDVILMDVQMPEMDGFEATAAIRALDPPGARRTPIVALTAHAMAGDRDRCLRLGFDDYLAKPIHATALAEALARAVAAESPSPCSCPPELVGHDRPAFDLESALEGLDGDEELLGEILALFLDETPRLVDQARRAIEAGDPSALGRVGHVLAGSAGHLAGPGVLASARRLEAIGRADDLAGADAALLEFGREFDRFRRAAEAPSPGQSRALSRPEMAARRRPRP